MNAISSFVFSYQWWNRLFLYSLFCFSTFTIAGENIAIAGLYIVFLLRSVKTPKLWKMPHPIFGALLIFLFFNLLSSVTSPYPMGIVVAIRDNLPLFLPMVLYFALEDIKDQRLLPVFCFFLILVSCYGIIQYFTGADWFRAPDDQSPTPYKHPCYALYGYSNVFHAKGNFTHHLTFGGVLLLCFPLFVSLSFCRELPEKTRGYYLIGSFIMILAILASLARSIWLGSMAALFIFSLRLPKKWLLLLICLGIGILSVMLWQYTWNDRKLNEQTRGVGLIWQRLESSFIIQYNQDRFLLWQTAWHAIKDHFWLGIGLNNDGHVMPQYRKPIIERTGHQFFNSAGAGVHNIYLQTWVNLGILGLLSYLLIWGLFFREGWKTLRTNNSPLGYYQSIMWGGFAGICGFLIAGIFENNYRDSEVQTVLFMILALLLFAIRQNQTS